MDRAALKGFPWHILHCVQGNLGISTNNDTCLWNLVPNFGRFYCYSPRHVDHRTFTSLSVLFYWATIYKTVRPMLSDRCLSVLSSRPCPVCYVGVLWPNGWMDQDATALGTEVGLGPGHIVSDGDPAPPKGAQPSLFGPCLLWL